MEWRFIPNIFSPEAIGYFVTADDHVRLSEAPQSDPLVRPAVVAKNDQWRTEAMRTLVNFSI
jgi:hypothetical protein